MKNEKDISKAELRMIRVFLKKPVDIFSTTEELAKELNLDKSTVQRSVKSLHELGLIHRSQTNQTVGGYLFKYKIKKISELKSVRDELLKNKFISEDKESLIKQILLLQREVEI